MHALDRTDPTFVQDLMDSQAAVDVVATYLRGRGYDVNVPELVVRPDASQRAQYSDGGDIQITQRVEVKHRKMLDFTSAASFPYPTIIVDVKHSYDRAAPKPYAYLILNRSMTTAFKVYGRTRPQWIVTRKLDRHAGREREFYECPIKLVETIQMPTLKETTP